VFRLATRWGGIFEKWPAFQAFGVFSGTSVVRSNPIKSPLLYRLSYAFGIMLVRTYVEPFVPAGLLWYGSDTVRDEILTVVL
jgi:hypothetical protein